MFTGMPSIDVEKSVPWSRLKPRRKYWLALPLPECAVATSPGTNSSRSPVRSSGCSAMSAWLTLPSEAEMASPTRFWRRPVTITLSRVVALAGDCRRAVAVAGRGARSGKRRSIALDGKTEGRNDGR